MTAIACEGAPVIFSQVLSGLGDYLILESVLKTFRYLSQGLSVVLIFIGLKMLAADFVHIPIGMALGIVMGVLAVAIVASIAVERRDRRHSRKPG